MKIAIMTQPLGRNYGGMMQAYALQKVLRDMGHDVTTINHQYKQPNYFYRQARLVYRAIKKITAQPKAPANLEKKIDYLAQDSQTFIDKYIVQSEPIIITSDLKNHFERQNYDVVIVGSDQTWRPKYSPNIYNYYLDFLSNNKNIKRIAYASSFGVDSWEYSDEETEKCAQLVALFDAISVREQSGVDLCKIHLGVDSECVLDPTLLLDKEDYLELIGDKYKGGQSEGVFTYILDSNEDKIAAADYVANELNTYTYKCQAKCSNDLNDYKMPSVQDWLASFANAEFVLTDSFHGMVFSIIFEKPFLVILNKERGAARFESLLTKLNSEDRLISNSKFIANEVLNVKAVKEISKDDVLEIVDMSKLFLYKVLV